MIKTEVKLAHDEFKSTTWHCRRNQTTVDFRIILLHHFTFGYYIISAQNVQKIIYHQRIVRDIQTHSAFYSQKSILVLHLQWFYMCSIHKSFFLLVFLAIYLWIVIMESRHHWKTKIYFSLLNETFTCYKALKIFLPNFSISWPMASWNERLIRYT